jgi:ribosome-interacting GTPase 1
LDLPGIIEGAAQGKGRGRQVRILIFNMLLHFKAGIVCELMQVIAVARTADLVLMILDATKKDIHKVCFNSCCN